MDILVMGQLSSKERRVQLDVRDPHGAPVSFTTSSETKNEEKASESDETTTNFEFVTKKDGQFTFCFRNQDHGNTRVHFDVSIGADARFRCASIHPFLRSFVHPFLHSFVHSFIHSFQTSRDEEEY